MYFFLNRVGPIRNGLLYDDLTSLTLEQRLVRGKVNRCSLKARSRSESNDLDLRSLQTNL